MRRVTSWLAGLLTAWVALAPGGSSAQESGQFEGYAPPAFPLPLPLFHTDQSGGLYVSATYVMLRQTNPIKDQLIAIRGFEDVDGSVTGTQGQFVGSRKEALDAQQVSGPGSYQPGFKISVGWKFEDSSTLDVEYMYLTRYRTTAVATPIPAGFAVGPQLADSFLTAFVFNFPTDFAGAAQKVPQGNNFAVYGIWNGAGQMSIDFLQRTDQYQMTYRVPVFETECYRLSGLVGPRFFWIWERFHWRTVDFNLDGTSDPGITAHYTNILSNRMYGVHFGCSNEYYMGHGFACQLDLEAAALLDVAREKVTYETGNLHYGPRNKRGRNDYTIVPELQSTLGVVWYPTEGIQIRFGYDLMAFFNTFAMQQPVTFDYSGLNPSYNNVFRLFDGFDVGIAFIF
jgi:hypothetical protein